MPLKEDKFIKFFVDWINQATLSGKNPSTGEPIKSKTISLYTKTYDHFTDYLIDEWGDPEIGMLDLDPECIEGFRKYAKDKLAETTIEKHVQRVRRIAKEAALHYGTEDLLARCKRNPVQAPVIYLTPEELQQIRDYNPSVSPWAKTKDFFLFIVNTGLEYDELQQLRKTHLKDNAITGLRPEIQIPLQEEAIQIIQTYQTAERDEIFPPMSLQKINNYLKEVATGAGITKRLTYSVALNTRAIHLLQSDIPLNEAFRLINLSKNHLTQRFRPFITRRNRQANAKSS